MKTMFIATMLTAALITVPAIAQQGPAGVPGAPGLAETVKSAPPSSRPRHRQRGPADCRTAKDVELCTARQEAHKTALEACKGKTGVERQQCMHAQAQNLDCTKAGNPQRCESRKHAYATCSAQSGPKFKQCVQQTMSTETCRKSADAARCELHQQARERCKNLIGQEHRQCLRDVLAPKK
ncbi:conserved exported hypothetical protein [Candidatus Propionivibrio aalborgensis]|uniref:Uncharacterized protein n=1 Tax=Candidatus Propionivibrio aalborgensis TaxID=1860101 RepID=A0A1A8XU76_9RHOO|nr:hypothetical protein [Candidatus Propionivibrio aalborgensis]SBT08286.1 conserved exported hypothetical protein [Candidatus Propionivibrio aalborgensis]